MRTVCPLNCISRCASCTVEMPSSIAMVYFCHVVRPYSPISADTHAGSPAPSLPSHIDDDVASLDSTFPLERWSNAVDLAFRVHRRGEIIWKFIFSGLTSSSRSVGVRLRIRISGTRKTADRTFRRACDAEPRRDTSES